MPTSNKGQTELKPKDDSRKHVQDPKKKRIHTQKEQSEKNQRTLSFFLAPVAFVAGMCLTTLARLPFRLGLGRVWTPSFIFRTLSPICTLVRTRILFRFLLLFVSLCCIYLDLGSLESLLYIYSFGDLL